MPDPTQEQPLSGLSPAQIRALPTARRNAITEEQVKKLLSQNKIVVSGREHRSNLLTRNSFLWSASRLTAYFEKLEGNGETAHWVKEDPRLQAALKALAEQRAHLEQEPGAALNPDVAKHLSYAVGAFQALNKLRVDFVIGRNTAQLLNGIQLAPKENVASPPKAAPTRTPTPTPTPKPTPAPTPTPRPQPALAQQPAPSPTPRPTATATPTPSPTPSPAPAASSSVAARSLDVQTPLARPTRSLSSVTQIVVHDTNTATVGCAVAVLEKRNFAGTKSGAKGSNYNYHFIIDQNGKVFSTAPLTEVVSHTAGANTNSIGISLVGGGTDAANRPRGFTAAQQESLKRLVTDLTGRYPQIRHVFGHRDVSGKPDPEGIDLDALANDVSKALGRSTPLFGPSSPEGLALQRRIEAQAARLSKGRRAEAEIPGLEELTKAPSCDITALRAERK